MSARRETSIAQPESWFTRAAILRYNQKWEDRDIENSWMLSSSFGGLGRVGRVFTSYMPLLVWESIFGRGVVSL